MAWLDGNKVAWTYTDSTNKTWRRAVCLSIVSQEDTGDAKVGGTAAAVTVEAFSRAKLRPRGVYCTAAGHPKKLVTIFSADAALLVAGTTINLNHGTDSVEYTSTTETIPERKIRSWSITQAS